MDNKIVLLVAVTAGIAAAVYLLYQELQKQRTHIRDQNLQIRALIQQSKRVEGLIYSYNIDNLDNDDHHHQCLEHQGSDSRSRMVSSHLFPTEQTARDMIYAWDSEHRKRGDSDSNSDDSDSTSNSHSSDSDSESDSDSDLTRGSDGYKGMSAKKRTQQQPRRVPPQQHNTQHQMNRQSANPPQQQRVMRVPEMPINGINGLMPNIHSLSRLYNAPQVVQQAMFNRQQPHVVHPQQHQNTARFMTPQLVTRQQVPNNIVEMYTESRTMTHETPTTPTSIAEPDGDLSVMCPQHQHHQHHNHTVESIKTFDVDDVQSDEEPPQVIEIHSNSNATEQVFIVPVMTIPDTKPPVLDLNENEKDKETERIIVDDEGQDEDDRDENGNKKVKYYKDTPINRKLGRVGQAY